jgi:hypothetical protein
MTTYGDVRTKFMARMNRRDLTTTLADGFLQDAIKRIQRTLRVPAQEKSIIVTVDTTYTTNGGIFIPSDYLKLRRISVDDTYFLTKEDERVVIPMSATVGIPSVFCRRGGTWTIGYTPAQDSVVRVDYWAEFDAMEATDDETILTAIAEDLLIYGALSYGCDHYNDKRGDKFEARYLQIVNDIEGQGDDDELAGGSAVQPYLVFDDDVEGTN